MKIAGKVKIEDRPMQNRFFWSGDQRSGDRKNNEVRGMFPGKSTNGREGVSSEGVSVEGVTSSSESGVITESHQMENETPEGAKSASGKKIGKGERMADQGAQSLFSIGLFGAS